MNCEDVAKYSALYLDNEFDAPERAELVAHLGQCADCREMLKAEQAFRETLREKLAPIETPQYLRQRITAEIDMLSREAAKEERQELFWGWARAIPLIAAAAVVVVLVWPEPHTATVDSHPGDDAVAYEGVPANPVRAERSPDGVRAMTVSYPSPVSANRVQGGDSARLSLTRFQRLPADVRGSEREILSYMQPRVSFRLIAPLRRSANVQLVGARQVLLGDQPAVLFVYNVRGQRVSVLQQPSLAASVGSVKLQRRGTLTVGTFDRAGTSNTVVSALSPAELSPALFHR